MEPPKISRTERNATLFKAIRSKNLESVRKALAAGADLNTREIVPRKPSLEERFKPKTYLGDTPLIAAVGVERADIITLLLDKGADINRTGEMGMTPLIESVRQHNTAITGLLLSCGARVDLTDEYSRTALQYATNELSISQMELLLKHGANPNGNPHSRELTPLHEAVSDIVVVGMLLRWKADPNIRRRGMTALERAMLQEADETATLLRKAGGRARPLFLLKMEEEQEKQRAEQESAMWKREFDEEKRVRVVRYANQRIVTEEDARVIEAVLLDLLVYRGRDIFRANHDGREIALVNQSPDAMGSFEENQMNGELTYEQASEITIPMREHLYHRNHTLVSYSTLHFNSKAIRRCDPNSIGSFLLGSFTKRYPEARLWISAYLPGINKAHDHAVLRYHLGPSPHGASGTTFLVKKRGTWRVKWREFAFYV